MAIMFPKSRVSQFYKDNPRWKELGLRLGQAFHQYMQLDKVRNAEDKAFCDQLYNADNKTANYLIISHVHWSS